MDSYIQNSLQGLVIQALRHSTCLHCGTQKTPRNGPLVAAQQSLHCSDLLSVPLWLCPMQFLCLNFHHLSFLTELSPKRLIYAYEALWTGKGQTFIFRSFLFPLSRLDLGSLSLVSSRQACISASSPELGKEYQRDTQSCWFVVPNRPQPATQKQTTCEGELLATDALIRKD